jgi:hypothetical protein
MQATGGDMQPLSPRRGVSRGGAGRAAWSQAVGRWGCAADRWQPTVGTLLLQAGRYTSHAVEEIKLLYHLPHSLMASTARTQSGLTEIYLPELNPG